MKKNLFLLPIFVLANMLPLAADIPCPHITKCQRIEKDAKEYCNKYVYDQFRKHWQSVNEYLHQDPRVLSAHMKNFSDQDQSYMELCLIARDQLNEARAVLNKHPKDCKFKPHMGSDNRLHFCSCHQPTTKTTATVIVRQ